MAKAKTVRKKKKTAEPQEVAQEQQQPAEQELSEEQMAQLMVDLDMFQNKFLSHLACTEKFEIIPTADDDGTVLSQEQLALIKREVNRLGLATIWTYDVGKLTIVMSARKDTKLLVGVISNGAEVH